MNARPHRKAPPPRLTDSPQTTVMKISMTFDPMVLVEWARAQKGVCCDEPVHDINLDFMPAELQAQFILAHAFLSTVPMDTVLTSAYATSIETGIPEEMAKRITEEYQQAMEAAGIIITCETCETRRADMGEVEDPYRAEIYGENAKEWPFLPPR